MKPIEGSMHAGTQLEGVSSTQLGSVTCTPPQDKPLSIEDALALSDVRGRHGQRVCAFCLLCVLCGGMGGAAAPFILEPVKQEANLSPAEEGAFASAMFVGMWVGSFVGGAIADSIGPGRAMAIAVAGLVVCGAAPAALPAYAVPAILGRLTVGFWLVIDYQAGNTYLAESIPTRRRGPYLTLLHVAIAIGGLLTTALRVAIPAWRLFLVVNSVPALVVLSAALRFVLAHESPRWLLVVGREAEASAIFIRISQREGGPLGQPGEPPLHLQLESAEGGEAAPEPSGEPRLPSEGMVGWGGGGGEGSDPQHEPLPPQDPRDPPQDPRHESPRARLHNPGQGYYSTWHRKLTQCRSAALWRVHAAGCAVAFCLNFGTKGSEIWLGKYINTLEMPTLATLIYFGAISGKIAGDVLNMTWGQRYGRLRVLQLSFFGAAACVLALCRARQPWLLLLLATGQGAFADMLWCNVYVYLAEAFPTSVRSTAFGFSMGIGRGGGVLSAVVGGVLPDVQLAFILYGLSFACGGLCVLCFRRETFGRPLIDAV